MRHLWRVGALLFQFDRARQFGGVRQSRKYGGGKSANFFENPK